MRITEIILVSWLIISYLEGCVDPYHPEIGENQQSIIIYGTLTDREGYHYISVYRSVSYKSDVNIPVQGCVVEVIDDSGNTIQFYENEPGLYEQWINQEYLKTGKKYKLRVTVADSAYESRYETMLPCPPVQNVYYKIETKGTSDPDNTIYGIQFYTDLVAHSGYAKNYRWELEETWEYHSEYMIYYIWDGQMIQKVSSGSDSLFYCWTTKSIHEIYTGSINHVTGDSLARIPLRYVSNETDRLKVKYSLLIKQYSLSDTAYEYWNQLKKLNQETGGLYETQPPQIRGNISNMHNASEIVLGAFNVSGLSEKRIFVSEHFTFFPPNYNCVAWVPPFGFPPSPLPIYLVYDQWEFKLADRKCFNCTLLGGTIQKPDFWE